jgi:dimethylhistidine N-methyltransferase
MSRGALDRFAADVARDLQRSPKQLQSHYLYDPLGSRLFEAICHLPWYRITRAEARLLRAHAGRVVSRLLGGRPGEVAIVELGVGSGEKLATIVEALPAEASACLHLIDVSADALASTVARVSALSSVRIEQHRRTYEEGLAAAAARIPAGTPTLLLFLGSNIGNFGTADAARLLRAMRGALRPGDLLLLGTDLVKPERDLILAYDDPLGVTAAFNKNLLVRVNQELGGTFDLAAFAHRAIWSREDQRVEMHLVSTIAQTVAIREAAVSIEFAAGEYIWTESSYKYTESAVAALAAGARFGVAEQWVDADGCFALNLLRAEE